MSSKLECGGRENDRETGWCSTNGIPVDCARSGDYFDRLDEPTGCTLISSALRGRGSQEGKMIAPVIRNLVLAALLLPTSGAAQSAAQNAVPTHPNQPPLPQPQPAIPPATPPP